ncbi:MAG TPA: hypothetical protein VF766_01425 [Pyrinomonadaceae bacterium]
MLDTSLQSTHARTTLFGGPIRLQNLGRALLALGVMVAKKATAR